MSLSAPILPANFLHAMAAEHTRKISKFMFWSDLEILVNNRVLAKISIIVTTRRHSTNMRKDFVAADCQTKTIECDYAVIENLNFDVTIMIFPLHCTLIINMHWESVLSNSELRPFGILSFGEV